MRNKRLLILFFVLLAGVSYTFAQEEDAVVVAESATDSAMTIKQKDEYLQQLKLVPKDTANQKIIHFETDFREKYKNDEEFDYTRNQGGKTFWTKLKERIYKLLSILFGWDKEHKVGNATNIAFKIISALIILVVLYFIVRFILRHEGKWFFQRKNEIVNIDVDDLEQLIQYADFEKMIAQSESLGDTRQSIRLYYLWLLRILKEKKLIEWNQQKTNADYMSELKEESVKQSFTYLSYLYNYIWYGEFSITDTDYVNAKKAFLTYLKRNGNNG